tara:strand:+ start:658 stop:837 length:180 start_codon:yes stop_codon:yes gene_type:complete
MSLEELVNRLAHLTSEEFARFCKHYSIGNWRELLFFLSELLDEDIVQKVSDEIELILNK